MGFRENLKRASEQRRMEKAQVRAANMQIRKESRVAALQERRKQSVAEAVRKERERAERKRGGGIFGRVAKAGGSSLLNFADRATRPTVKRRTTSRRK